MEPRHTGGGYAPLLCGPRCERLRVEVPRAPIEKPVFCKGRGNDGNQRRGAVLRCHVVDHALNNRYTSTGQVGMETGRKNEERIRRESLTSNGKRALL